MLTVDEILQKMSEIFVTKIADPIDLTVQLKLMPDDLDWYLSSTKDEPFRITRTISVEPEAILIFSEETLRSIYAGKLTGLTAMGRENMSDQTPLDFKLGKNVSMTPELMDKFYAFVQRFFNPTHPEKVQLNKKSARLVHGGWAIPMFYHTGFRSAWYQLDKGQKLNEPGDVNPFQQAFVIISGQGYAKIGKNLLDVGSGEAYYIPPNADHVLWNDDPEPLCLIYLAWGEKA